MKPGNYDFVTRTQEYIAKMHPVFNKRAVFSDETENYRTPAEPEPGDMVTIRLRTLKNNVELVYFISGATRLQMEIESSRDGFDYYAVQVPVGTETIHYFFELQVDRLRCYYNQLGVTRDLQEYHSFALAPGFHTPEWAKGAVMYQIFVDRFYNGDKTNDVENHEYFYIGDHTVKVEDWDKPPAAMGVREFYGGDIQGIIDKLDYLQDLGVEVLYLNPIFVSPSNHKYDIQDYDYVDPHYGKIVEDEGDLLHEGDKDNTHATRYINRVTGLKNLEASNAIFAELVEELHRRGMKIILDGVFNHCGSFNKWLDRERIYEHEAGYEKGAYVDKDSPYHTFFKFNNEHAWPYNEFYDGWWGHDTLPKLNYEESEKLFGYIMHVAAKWVSPPYNVDGWRLDVAADLGHSQEYNHFFWREFRKTVKEANPNAVILAEHYGEPSTWLQGDQWDTVMNYDAFMEPISWFLTGMEKHSDEYRGDLLGNGQSFVDAMRYHMSSFMAPSLQCAMNELSNHDHSRFLTRTNHVVGRVAQLGSNAADQNVNFGIFRAAVVMQMTWVGAPAIYYGDEAGVCGFTDPDNRRTYPWGHENVELIEFHKEIIKIHKAFKVIKNGSTKALSCGHRFICYGRFNQEEQILVAVNSGGEKISLSIPVWEMGIARTGSTTMRQLILSNGDGYSIEAKVFDVVGGFLDLELPGYGAIVLLHAGDEV
ncbi:MAG: glycoside hydrolase family 13 protein [Lachnospiraceae bacterium]|nr:glycoside hydrolase family 13 protein [Lachnospiraceae bacterium]